MKFNNCIRPLLVWALAFPVAVHAQVPTDSAIVLNSLEVFEPAGKIWSTGSDIVINPIKPDKFKKTAGNGIIVADAGKIESSVVSQKRFGDAELEFDFLLAKGTISAVLLQGRYRLNLTDSWAELKPSYNSMGGITPQGAPGSTGFSGAAPLMNVARAPGLWQHVRLRFKAPEFVNGFKSRNALFEEVYINDCLVQQNMELRGPSYGSLSTNEESEGPIAFYSSGGVFAIRNLKIRKLVPVTATRPQGRRFRVVNPIIITPDGSNYLLRSFINFNNKKRTHVISVGNPRQINYTYDLKQGALLQVWNGPFVDVTEMWEQRGEPQLAKPLGSVIPLSEAPALAILQDANAAWPDSVAFDNFRNMGYTLDKERNPSFEYETGGYHVWDKISPGIGDRSLLRQFDVTNIPANLYCRVASSSAISSLGKGMFVIGDKKYYVQVDEKLKPFVRNTSSGAELIIPVTATRPVSYSLIW